MKSPNNDEIKFIRFHTGFVQDVYSGNFYQANCAGRLAPIEQFEHDNAVLAKFKCLACGKWVNIELHNWR